MLGCAKTKVLGDGHEERDFVDVHDVPCHDDMLVLFQTTCWDSSLIDVDCWGLMAYHFSFERPQVFPKNVIGSEYIMASNQTIWEKMFINDLYEVSCAWTANDLLHFPS